MSATNRRAKRNPYDFYATPEDVVQNVLNHFDLTKYGNEILEPSAGNGNICKIVKAMYPNKNLTGLEIREEEQDNLNAICDQVMCGDYLKLNSSKKYDIIIGNPPFSLAKEFVEKSLDLLNENGVLIFLLRTAFLESKKRFDFWQSNPVTGLYVLSKRPSFLSGGGTDATSYSWFVWDKSTNKQFIQVI